MKPRIKTMGRMNISALIAANFYSQKVLVGFFLTKDDAMGLFIYYVPEIADGEGEVTLHSILQTSLDLPSLTQWVQKARRSSVCYVRASTTLFHIRVVCSLYV